MTASAKGRTARILVADDHIVNRRLTQRQLQTLGFSVDIVETGREAVDAMSRAPYDLVFMDCNMPEMDGFEATEEIRRREGAARHTPIVAFTASVTGPERDRCLQSGMDDIALKPITEADLRRVLQRWVFDAAAGVLDPAKLELLRELSGDLVRDVIAIYLEDAPSRIAAIHDAISRGDAASLASSAHGLRSSSGNVGAKRMLEICTRLEELGRTGSIDGAADLGKVLDVEFERTTRALREVAS